MKKVTKKVLDELDAWAVTPSRHHCGKVCSTCKMGDKVITCVRQFMQARVSGKSRKRNSEFHEWLARNAGYKFKIGTLNGHMRRCEKDLYHEMRKADIRYKMVLGPAKMDKVIRQHGVINEQK